MALPVLQQQNPIEGAPDALYLRRERRAIQLFLFCTMATLAHFVHNAWVYTEAVTHSIPLTSQQPRVWLFRPTPPQFVHAPEAYRVAMYWLGSLIFRLTHQEPALIASELDFVFGSMALYVFYRLLSDRLPINIEVRAKRLVVIATYLVFAELAITWTVVYQRPETLPSAAFIAIALFTLRAGPRGKLWTVALLAASLWQAFTRADVVTLLGTAIAIAALAGWLEEFGSRSLVFAKGIAVAAIGVGVQAYLQLVRFPHLTYWPGTSVVQVAGNLQKHTFGNFIVAVVPFAIPPIYAAFKGIPLNAVERIIVIASALYLSLWFAVGSFGEVRIFVPFMLALCVLAGRVIPEALMNDEVSPL